jgi:hypothetical protein
MGKLIDSKGQPVEAEIKDNEFIDGKRLIFTIYELEGNKGLKIIAGTKKFANPFVQESFWKKLYEMIKEETLKIKIEDMVVTTMDNFAKKAMEQQLIQQSIEQAANAIDKNKIL